MGMATKDEIGETIAIARHDGCEHLVLLHCSSGYSTSIDQANLYQIQQLAEDFGMNVGLSDHTMGTNSAVAAAALGACVIEKYFTLDRSDRGSDSEFALEPQELNCFCRDTRNAWRALGVTGYQRSTTEQQSRVFRRSIYFVIDLKAGDIVNASDIRRIRPGFGLHPKIFDQLVGKEFKIDVRRGTPTS